MLSVESNCETYTRIALSQAPRILGLCDRDPDSRTYGSCDRYYWQYRLMDIPNARFQEVCWFLALLHIQPPESSPYAGAATLLEWVEAMIAFWLKHRHSDGSVDEVYPFERSFCATSFSALAVTESLMLLNLEAPKAQAFAKTGRWLARNQNPTLSNQQAASLVALTNIARLTGESEFEKAAMDRKRALLSSQDPSGFFPEYGGMDVGYLTITLSLLALYCHKTRDTEVEAAGWKAADFLAGVLDGEGRYDYRNTSRKTQYVYPSGLAYFAPELLERHLRGVRTDKAVTPAWMDDRYCIALATDYLLTPSLRSAG